LDVEAAEATRLRAVLEEHLKSPRATFAQLNQRARTASPLSEDEIKRLKALGYF
jgi:hypothetical protein